jgi:autotransporter translocation and assembly factor TamB
MSHKSILRAALLLVVIVAVASCVAQVTASWTSGSQSAASWVSGAAPLTDTSSDSGS